MQLRDFDYDLPEELIAQTPASKRELSKMLVLDRTTSDIQHKQFFDVLDYFDENDVLILNNTKVIPARLIGQKDTGARIEVFLLKNTEGKTWEALIKPAKRVREGTIIEFSSDLQAKVLGRTENEKMLIELLYEGDFYKVLDKVGLTPLPPYIERKMTSEEIKNLDEKRYQTVYAKHAGSVAAPTAGLHFTDEILDALRAKGVEVGFVNLSVGLGTFRPVKCENVLEHKMDSENYEVPQETVEIIRRAKSQNKKVTAVGTTTVRTLETVMKEHGEIVCCSGASELFIYPGYEFKIVDRLITNFHLPKSTLLMLISALAGKDNIFRAYEEAISKQYRFYSYGDCMFIK